MTEHAVEHGASEAGGHHHGRYQPHVVPLWLLAAVFGALLVLTWITVAVAQVDMGALTLPIALLVAAVKASLVMLYFMHLRWDSPFNSVVLVVAFLFLAVFLWIAIIDSGAYAEHMERTVDREGLTIGGGTGVGAEAVEGDGAQTAPEEPEAAAGEGE